jgi:antitoxin (DNA-binding transcriptional repressor) of toxin-antitoxin stability system
MNTINASDFKARCLAILKDVEQRGTVVTILRHGKPVAELRPSTKLTSDYPQEELKGSVEIVGDILEPVITQHDLRLERGLL